MLTKLKNGHLHIQYYRKNESNSVYNYHPGERGYKELYVDKIYESILNIPFSPDQRSWVHTISAKALPSGDIYIRVRLLYPPMDPYDKSCATKWSQYFNIYNYGGWDNYDNGSIDEEKFLVTLTFQISADIDNAWNRPIRKVTISAHGITGESNIDSTSVTINTSDSKYIVEKLPTPYSYQAVVAVYYSSGTTDVFEKYIDHTLYLPSNQGSANSLFFSDAVKCTIW